MTRSKKKLHETSQNGTIPKIVIDLDELQQAWNKLQPIHQGAIQLLHTGNPRLLNSVLTSIGKTESGLRIKLDSVNCSPETKKWAKSLLAHYSELIFLLDMFSNEELYALIPSK